jgi:acetone carboxylase gamma subunit
MADLFTLLDRNNKALLGNRVAEQKQNKEQLPFSEVMNNINECYLKNNFKGVLPRETAKRVMGKLIIEDAFQKAVEASGDRIKCAEEIISQLYKILALRMFSQTDDVSPMELKESWAERSKRWEDRRSDLADTARNLIEMYESTFVDWPYMRGLDPRPPCSEWNHCRLDVEHLKRWADNIESASINNVFTKARKPINGVDDMEAPANSGNNTPKTRSTTMFFRAIEKIVPLNIKDRASIIRKLLMVAGVEMSPQQARNTLSLINRNK